MIDNIILALFGDNPVGQHAVWRDELRTAYDHEARKKGMTISSPLPSSLTDLVSSEAPSSNAPIVDLGEHPILMKSDVEVSIRIGHFYQGAWCASEFDQFSETFLQHCFDSGFHNCRSSHVGGNFSVVQYWQVPLEFAEEIRRLAATTFQGFGMICDPKLVQAREFNDGRPSVVLIVGKKEIAILWDMHQERTQQGTDRKN
jgi:hypothetical protein